jgi:tyrosyl-tRNA synthetase
MDIETRLELIKRDTVEIVTEPELRKVLRKRKPVAYWGTAPTGQVHTGYLIPVQKMLDFVKAGFRFKVLIADIHAYLDDIKTPWELLKTRSEYYKKCLQSLGLRRDVEYVFDSDFKYDRDYVQNVYKLSALVTLKRALRAAAEVCRLRTPKVSELLYPLAQTVDCPKLGVDVAYSGLDQRHIYALSREMLPKIGLKAPVLVMSPMLSSLVRGAKASASIPESNIRIYESPASIRKKIAKAWCPPEAAGNPILEHYKYIIFPKIGKVMISRPAKFGGDVEFKEYAELEAAYLRKRLHAADLKADLAERLIKLLAPCRKYWEKHKGLIKEAYPEEKI